jgi:hypothetical protein
MVDLVLRKTGNKKPEREYVLMIRDFSSGIELDWSTLCYMDHFSASQIEGEQITYWDGDAEEKPEVKQLRLEHPSLREAWENYQVLKVLHAKPKS